MSIRVVVADDQELVRAGLVTILRQVDDISVVGEASDGSEAIELARRLRPDVAVLDVRMPGIDGIEATRQIVQSGDDDPVRVLILTTFDLDEYVFEALRAGASGFLLKDAPRGELERAVRVVAAGEGLLSPAVTLRVVERFAEHRRPGSADASRLEALTEREQEVLGLMATGRSNAEIAEHLVLSETTVRTHVSHVLTKLAVRDRVQAVVLAYESGFVQPGGRS